MTIKEISKLAGVSAMTVSNVINKRYNKVSQATIDKVERIIKEQNYIPNKSAATLSSKSSKIIGVLFPSSEKPFLENPFHASILSGIQEVADANNYYVIPKVVSSKDDVFTLIHNWSIDGLIILPLLNEVPHDINKPVVLIDEYREDYKYPIIRNDDFENGYQAAKLLHENGHQRISLMSYNHEKGSILDVRVRGVQKYFDEHQLNFEGAHFVIPFDKFESDDFEEYFIDKITDFTAVFTLSDLLAIKVMKILEKHQLSVPNDLSVIGYDNIEFCNYTNPTLSSIDQDVLGKGKESVNLLLKQINGESVKSINIHPSKMDIKESIKPFK